MVENLACLVRPKMVRSYWTSMGALHGVGGGEGVGIWESRERQEAFRVWGCDGSLCDPSGQQQLLVGSIEVQRTLRLLRGFCFHVRRGVRRLSPVWGCKANGLLALSGQTPLDTLIPTPPDPHPQSGKMTSFSCCVSPGVSPENV